MLQGEEVIDKVVKEAISKPWLPLPIGLKPPSIDSVLAELSRQGISTIPPPNGHHPCWPGTLTREAAHESQKEDLIPLYNTSVDKCYGPNRGPVFSIERSRLGHVCDLRTTEVLVVVNRADMKLGWFMINGKKEKGKGRLIMDVMDGCIIVQCLFLVGGMKSGPTNLLEGTIFWRVCPLICRA